MILFCDTSALMKLYADEQHSTVVRTVIKRASTTMVSAITWVEIHAAFGLKQRTDQVTKDQVREGLVRLAEEWANFFRIGAEPELIAHAGELALRFGLRAYDSVQLASAHRAHQQVGSVLSFLCFDKQLNVAATALGLNVFSV